MRYSSATERIRVYYALHACVYSVNSMRVYTLPYTHVGMDSVNSMRVYTMLYNYVCGLLRAVPGSKQ